MSIPKQGRPFPLNDDGSPLDPMSDDTGLSFNPADDHDQYHVMLVTGGLTQSHALTETAAPMLVASTAFAGVVTDFESPEEASALAAGVTSDVSPASGLILTNYMIDGTADPASHFNIVIRYTGDAAYEPYFEAARARWEQVITADIPNSSYNGTAVDDLLIDANVSLIDGAGSNGRNVLGSAGPDWVRVPSYLPVHGTMTFDSYDIAAMASAGLLDEVILHEMGHVLGFGTVWTNLGLRVGDASYYGFTGSNALAEYRAISGNSSATSVPVEPGTQSGSSGSHWSESVFTNELMTPTTGPGTDMPLSDLTIASLEDLGYTVNLAAADPYAFSSGAGSVSISDVTITEGNSGTQSAVFNVTRTGGTAAFTVNFSTANGTATDNSDYVAKSGTLNFGSGVNTQSVSITINGDTTVENNETFLVNLSNATNGATIDALHGSATGTILNDDTAPVTTTPTPTPNPWGTPAGHNASHDFNVDLHSDILLQNVKTGDAFIWEMNGTSLVGIGAPGWTPGAAWQIKDNGDYNGDGKSDILLQNADTGDAYVWLMNGTGVTGGGAVGWTPGAAWQIKDGGDFNGDGKADILMQNANTGDVYIWEMNGTSIVANGAAGWTPGAAWQVKGTGDFNGDGKSDIVLQNANTGDVYIWEMNGTSLVGSSPAGPTLGAAWQVKATGDYNGDGMADILFQNVNTGDVSVSLMFGTNGIGGGPAGWTPGAGWQVKDSGDYNGDGKADILLQNASTGDAYVWLMNGNNVIGGGAAGWTPGADWHIF